MLWKHGTAVNRSDSHKRNAQPSKENVTALACATRDAYSQVNVPTAFQNNVFPSKSKFNLALPAEDKALSCQSKENSKTTPVFLSSSWKSSCTMFVLCGAAFNESRHTATPMMQLGWVLFLSCLQNIKGKREQSEMGVTCMSEVSLKPQWLK